jgi:hypothetical protein
MLKAITQNPPLSNIGNGTRLRRSQSHQDTLLSRYASIWDERPGFRRRNPLGTCRNRGPSTRRVGSRGPQDKPRSRRMSTVGEPGQTQDPRTRAKSLLQDQQKISSLQTPPASPTAGGCRGSKNKSVTQRCSAVAEQVYDRDEAAGSRCRTKRFVNCLRLAFWQSRLAPKAPRE